MKKFSKKENVFGSKKQSQKVEEKNEKNVGNNRFRRFYKKDKMVNIKTFKTSNIEPKIINRNQLKTKNKKLYKKTNRKQK